MMNLAKKDISPDSNNISPSSGSGKGKMKLRIFNSFKEQEDEMIAYWASITPLQRLAHLYEMITVSFRLPEGKLSNPHPPRTIKVIKYEP